MRKFNITVNGTLYEVEVEEVTGTSAPAPQPAAAKTAAPLSKNVSASKAGSEGAVKITAPMPGTIMKVSVSAGQVVKKGDIVCILEAMKMENEIFAPQTGIVASVNVSQGDTVSSGDLLVSLK